MDELGLQKAVGIHEICLEKKDWKLKTNNSQENLKIRRENLHRLDIVDNISDQNIPPSDTNYIHDVEFERQRVDELQRNFTSVTLDPP